MSRQAEIKQFLSKNNVDNWRRVPLQSDASFRRYERLMGASGSMMLMDAPPPQENVAPFIYVDEYLRKLKLNAPKIYAQDQSLGCLLLEDLGDDSFTKVLASATLEDEYHLYQKAIDILVHLSVQPLPKSMPVYDQALYTREVQLLVDWYMPNVASIQFTEELKREYVAIWEKLLQESALPQDTLVLRDYHADNLMWLPKRSGLERVGLLDFQDAVIGCGIYDLISLLEDARRDIAPKNVKRLIEYYLRAFPPRDKELFELHYALLAAQRNCKIIGIFSRLAVRDKKIRYLNYLPRVWGHLDHDLQHPKLRPLKQWFDKVMEIKHRDTAYFTIPQSKAGAVI